MDIAVPVHRTGGSVGFNRKSAANFYILYTI